MNHSSIYRQLPLLICCLCSFYIYGQSKGPAYVPGQVFVKMKDSRTSTRRTALKGQMKAFLRRKITNSSIELWDIDQSQGKTDIDQLINQYRNHPDIDFLEPNYYYYLTIDDCPEMETDRLCLSSNTDVKGLSISASNSTNASDLYFPNQWALNNTGQDNGTPDADIDAPEAWEITSTSPSIVVGLIDSGVDWTHPDLVNNIWQNLGEDADNDGRVLEWDGDTWVFDPGDTNNIDDDNNGYVDDFIGWDFVNEDNDPFDDSGDAYGHGTHVAGTIGAEGNNGIGVSGVTRDVQIAALRVFDKRSISMDTIIQALNYAIAMDIPITNNSYAGAPFNETLRHVIQEAETNGHLFIAASGNDANDNDSNPYYPSSYDLNNIISVASSDRNDLLSEYSNFGSLDVDIAAPGDSIFSTVPQNGYGIKSGTSMATPHVTGTCALLWELHPDKTYAEIKNAILNTADKRPDLSGKCVSEGRLNLSHAMTYYNSSQLTGCRFTDSLALVAFYNATDGANWNSYYRWYLTTPIEWWSGVELDINGCVKSLNLFHEGLKGYIPPEIGNLSNLEYLALSGDQLIGSIPREIGNLSNLEYIRLFGDQLIGSIPPEIGNLSNLKELVLSINQLTGSIPSAIGNLSNLKKIKIIDSQLTGSIPTEIGNLKNLETLILFRNQLNESIPKAIGGLSNLITLSLSNTQLTGGIPSEIGSLSKLEDLHLGFNQLSGSIPSAIENLSELKSLNLYGNQLSGNIPSGLWNLMNLTSLTLSSNQLTGSISPEIENLSKLKRLSISRNYLSGSIPPQIGSLSNLRDLDLIYNQLSGEIPSETGNLKRLESLDLRWNQLTGGIPPEIGTLSSLKDLALTGNQLEGCYDVNLLNLHDVGTNSRISDGNNFDANWEDFFFNLDGTGACSLPNYNSNCKFVDSLVLISIYNSLGGTNWSDPWNLDQPFNTWDGVEVNGFGCVVSLKKYDDLVGSIPSDIGYLSNLRHLSLASSNSLHGSIPPQIGNLMNLRTLNLSFNDLSGVIPPEIGNLINLTSISLSSNQLTDSIPPEIGNLVKLSSLSLSSNQLTGNIPQQIGDLEFLESLDLSYNQLDGCYDDNLSGLCTRLDPHNHIGFANNFDSSWEDFCNNGSGSCSEDIAVSPVWPGDYNYDGTVNETDAIYLGYASGNTGSARPSATTAWQGQEAPDWTTEVDGINGKHQDGDGSGLVDTSDRQVIIDNFGKSHTYTEAVYIASSVMYGLVENGQVNGYQSFDLYVTDSNANPISLHGLAGVIDFGDWDVSDIIIQVNDSYFPPSNTFKNFDSIKNRLHFALTRSDRINQLCIDPVAKFVVISNGNPVSAGPTITIQNGNTLQASGDLETAAGMTLYATVPSGLASHNLVVGASVIHEQCTTPGSVSLNVKGGELPYSYNWNTGSASSRITDLTPNVYKVTVTDALGETKTLSVEVQGEYITIPDEFGNIPDCIHSPCPTLLTPNGNISTGQYKAGIAVNSTGVVTGGVQFRAGETIILGSNFEVQLGKTFSAQIEDCSH